MEQQLITWPEVSAAGDRWHALQQELESHRHRAVELEQQVEQARQEFQRGLTRLGVAGAGNVEAHPHPAPLRAAAVALVPCANGCGQEIKPRGQTAHNRYCPKYTTPTGTAPAAADDQSRTLAAAITTVDTANPS